MGSVITLRNLEPGDRTWLRHQARLAGLSVEEYVRRLIREKREESEPRHKPSEVFGKHFGATHGTELPPTRRYRHKAVTFGDETEG